ncbi:hypothetical protein F2Q69_00013696 [Brassica cretica]|uniref:Uncharacterized protein n=1 Tax=Brassica cretica TaxID=69181 RepID=A0A8S9QY58_BRACR|nr:hypothetical protein F2Q69_00013696 [Brassica cretica]
MKEKETSYLKRRGGAVFRNGCKRFPKISQVSRNGTLSSFKWNIASLMWVTPSRDFNSAAKSSLSGGFAKSSLSGGFCDLLDSFVAASATSHMDNALFRSFLKVISSASACLPNSFPLLKAFKASSDFPSFL